MPRHLTAVIKREGSSFVANCPELDIASQGESVEEARGNLKEAVELFFEVASKEEVLSRMNGEMCVTKLDITGMP